MRDTIETAPKDGEVVILEDDASGSYDIARWSPEAGGWVVGENAEPIKITPSLRPCTMKIGVSMLASLRSWPTVADSGTSGAELRADLCFASSGMSHR